MRVFAPTLKSTNNVKMGAAYAIVAVATIVCAAQAADDGTQVCLMNDGKTQCPVSVGAQKPVKGFKNYVQLRAQNGCDRNVLFSAIDLRGERHSSGIAAGGQGMVYCETAKCGGFSGWSVECYNPKPSSATATQTPSQKFTPPSDSFIGRFDPPSPPSKASTPVDEVLEQKGLTAFECITKIQSLQSVPLTCLPEAEKRYKDDPVKQQNWSDACYRVGTAVRELCTKKSDELVRDLGDERENLAKAMKGLNDLSARYATPLKLPAPLPKAEKSAPPPPLASSQPASEYAISAYARRTAKESSCQKPAFFIGATYGPYARPWLCSDGYPVQSVCDQLRAGGKIVRQGNDTLCVFQ